MYMYVYVCTDMYVYMNICRRKRKGNLSREEKIIKIRKDRKVEKFRAPQK